MVFSVCLEVVDVFFIFMLLIEVSYLVNFDVGGVEKYDFFVDSEVWSCRRESVEGNKVREVVCR